MKHRPWLFGRVLGGLVVASTMMSADVAVSGGASAHFGGERSDFCRAIHVSPGRCRAIELHDEMRKLWEDHIVWTRMVIVSVIEDLPDAGPTVARLLQNQVDIGNAFRPFYGDAAADRLTQILTEHILIAADILAAAKAGDAEALEESIARWGGNADEFALFWSRVNRRFLTFEEVRHHMQGHLDATIEEAVARLNGDFEADIAAYDRVHDHILGMSDLLSTALIRQFSRRFR